MRRFSEPITFGSDGANKRGHEKRRQNGRRIPAPIGLFVLVLPDQFVRLDLQISLEGCGSPVDCFLYDVNKGGVGVVCTERLDVGARVHILGNLAVSSQPQLDVNAILVDRRDFPADRPRPRGFEDRPLFVHGLSMDPGDARILLNATQECLDIIRRETEVAPSGGGAPQGMVVEELKDGDAQAALADAEAQAAAEPEAPPVEDAPPSGATGDAAAPGSDPSTVADEAAEPLASAGAESADMDTEEPDAVGSMDEPAMSESAMAETMAPAAPRQTPGDSYSANTTFGYLPIAEVEMTEEEVRRRSTRDDLAVELFILMEGEEKPRNVDLRIRKEGTDSDRAVHSEMLNFSPEGARLLANIRLKIGERVVVTGFCAAEESVLFELPFTVRNMSAIERMRGAIAKRARQMGDHVSAFGLELDAGVENLLYKAALDSIYLAARNNSSG